MRVTILGCGGSDGVPRIGGPDGKGDWGACDPANPKNRRTRVSVFVETDEANLLIDTSPDLREQALREGISRVDAVLYTHEHADHSHGLHEIRRLGALRGEGPLPVYADPATLESLQRRFDYAFLTDLDSPYLPIATAIAFDGPFEAAGVPVVPIRQDHGFGQHSFGFRIGDFAYSTDVVGFPDDSREALFGLETWVVDCVQMRPGHPTHASLDTVVQWVDAFKPRRTVLTHMGPDLDYEELRKWSPKGIEPAYDGMTLTL